jgi:hypothetical protein
VATTNHSGTFANYTKLPKILYDRIINPTSINVNFTLDWYSTLIEKVLRDMHVDIDCVSKNNAQTSYMNWLLESGYNELEMRVKSIACLYGWSQLAYHLNTSEFQNNGTAKNPLFNETFIYSNVNFAPDSLIAFLNDTDYYNLYKNNKTHYNDLFQTGLWNEIAFFNSAIGQTIDPKCVH